MANIKTSDVDAKLFTASDAYRYDIDNRPLRELIQNDININNELVATTTEVVNARTDNTTGTPVAFGTLDARLEAMGLSSLGNSSVSYSIFQNTAERARALYPSGWLAQPNTFQFASTGAFSGDDWGGLFGTDWNGLANPNQMYINNSYSGLYNPNHLFVNGWHIKLLNMNANGATAYGKHTTIKLPAAPTSGVRQDFVFLEVWLKEIPDSNKRFWLYGSPQYNIGTLGVSEGTYVLDTNGSNGNYVANPLDERVVHSLARLANGNWLQVQHRIRVFSGVNPKVNADGFTGTTGSSPAGNAEQVFAQGSQNAPVSSKPFATMTSTLTDAGLYRAGNGAADSSALGTIDGYSYAIPIAMVHRRNTATFTMTNQNGSALIDDPNPNSGSIIGSYKSGRPDGKSYDSIHRDDYLDMRHWIEPKGFEYERLLERAFDNLLTGVSREQWEGLNYSGVEQSIYGNRLMTNDSVFDLTTYGSDPNAAVTVTNHVKDNSKAGAPQAKPDGVRQMFAASGRHQRFEFWVDPWANTTSHSFITYATPGAGNKKISFALETLSGGGGTGGTYLRTVDDNNNTLPSPTWRWQTDNSEVSPTRAGTLTTPTFEWDISSRSAADGRVYGYIEIIFPSKSGTLRLPREVVRQEIRTSGGFTPNVGFPTYASKPGTVRTPYAISNDAFGIWVANYNTRSIGHYTLTADGTGGYEPGQLSVPLQASNIVGNFPDGSAGTFSYPTGIAIYGVPHQGTGAIYVADYYNRSIKKYTYNQGTSKWTPVSYVKNIGHGATSFGTTSSAAGPWALSVSADGTQLYAVDLARHVVFKIATSTFTGTGVASGTATVIAGVLDTPGETITTGSIKLRSPRGVTATADGIWIADTGNGRVLKIDLNTPANVLVNFKSTSSSLPEDFSTALGMTIPLGADASNPTGYISIGGGQGEVRVYRMDDKYNITAVSNTPYRNTNPYNGAPIIGAAAGAWNLARTIAVDSLTAPTRVYVGKDGSRRNNANEVGIEVLNATTLATISRSSDSLNNQIGGAFSLQYIDGGLFAVCNNSGIGGIAAAPGMFTARFTVTSDVVALASNYSSTTYGDSFGYISNMITYNFGGAIGNRKAFWQTIALTGNAAGPRAVRWSYNGSAWVRDGAVITFASGDLPLAVTQGSASAAVYFALPYENLIKRYDFTAASGTTYTLTANFGTGEGSTGGAKNQVTGPVSVVTSADGTRILVVCNKQKAFGNTDSGRLVWLNTTQSQWTGGNSPYLGDTNNTAIIVCADMLSPTGVGVSPDGTSVYITDSARHVMFRMLRTFGTDNKSFMRTGYFGVLDEAGSDHGHLSAPYAVIPWANTRIAIADSGNNRFIDVHPKHGGVSKGSGDIMSMTALEPTDTLRVWYNTVAYQGVGTNFLAADSTEIVQNNQILSLSDSVYASTLGRSFISDAAMSNKAGAIDRLPLAGKLSSYDASSFTGSAMTLEGLTLLGGMPMLKAAILSHGQSLVSGYGSSQGENAFLQISTIASHLSAVNRGYTVNASGSFKGWPIKSAAPAHVSILPALVKRGGKVYMVVLTHVWPFGNSSNQVGASGSGTRNLMAVDFFEVPGRLLAR